MVVINSFKTVINGFMAVINLPMTVIKQFNAVITINNAYQKRAASSLVENLSTSRVSPSYISELFSYFFFEG